MIWLEADERIEQEEAFEARKTELSIRWDQLEVLLKVMQDLRWIALCNTPLKEDKVDDFINRLPSNKNKEPDKPQRKRSTVKKRKPGEIPEWKKRRAKQNNDNCQKTG